MFNSTILDVGIGLITVYLVASLGVTATNEFIAALTRLRARKLAVGIGRLLQGDTALVEKFYDHPLVRALSRDNHKPSYIPSRTFVLATLGTASGEAALAQRSVDALIASVANADLQRVLRLFAAEVHGDVDALLTRMERWYDDAMERVAGWYKRHVQFISFSVACVLTLLLNVDTLRIVTVLWTSGPARQAIVSYAEVLRKERAPAPSGDETTVAKPPGGKSAEPGAPSSISGGPSAAHGEIGDAAKAGGDVTHQVQKLIRGGLPIGWDHFPKPKDAASLPGWLLSAFAISLGAPFWFDVLNRFMEVRSSGKAPKESPKPPEDKSSELKVGGNGQRFGAQPPSPVPPQTPAPQPQIGAPAADVTAAPRAVHQMVRR